MTPKRSLRLLVFTAVFSLAASVANARIVTFIGTDAGANSTDPQPNSNAAAASFDASGEIETLFNFESTPLGSFSSITLMTGVTLSASNGSIVNSPLGTPDSLFGYNTTSGGSRFLSLFGGTATFTFDTPVDDFGAFISGVQLNGETITFSDGTSQTIVIPNPGSGVSFVGFTDVGKSISSIQLNVSGDIVGVDDVRISRSQATATPEPGTWSLIAASLLGVLAWRRARVTT